MGNDNQFSIDVALNVQKSLANLEKALDKTANRIEASLSKAVSKGLSKKANPFLKIAEDADKQVKRLNKSFDRIDLVSGLKAKAKKAKIILLDLIETQEKMMRTGSSKGQAKSNVELAAIKNIKALKTNVESYIGTLNKRIATEKRVAAESLSGDRAGDAMVASFKRQKVLQEKLQASKEKGTNDLLALEKTTQAKIVNLNEKTVASQIAEHKRYEAMFDEADKRILATKKAASDKAKAIETEYSAWWKAQLKKRRLSEEALGDWRVAEMKKENSKLKAAQKAFNADFLAATKINDAKIEAAKKASNDKIVADKKATDTQLLNTQKALGAIMAREIKKNNKKALAAQKALGASMAKDLTKANKSVSYLNKNIEKNIGIIANWYQHFGRVAIGFTLAYRAMNLFESGFRATHELIKEAILDTGELAGMQAELATYYSITSGNVEGFSTYMKRAAVNVEALRVASLTAVSTAARFI